MNMSVKINAASLLPNKLMRPNHAFQVFFLNFAYIICNSVYEINKPKSQTKAAVSHNVNAHHLG